MVQQQQVDGARAWLRASVLVFINYYLLRRHVHRKMDIFELNQFWDSPNTTLGIYREDEWRMWRIWDIGNGLS